MAHDEGLVEDLNKRLYKRGVFKADTSRADFSLPHNELPHDWKPEEDNMKKNFLTPSFLKKLFLFSMVFFALAALAATYIVMSGSNVISSGNLDVSLKGPTSVGGGDEFNLGIVIANNNPIPLESVDLIVAFPSGTRDASDLTKDLTRYRKNIGTIEEGAIINESVKAVLFGSAGNEQEIRVTIEYRTAGSNAIFDKVKIYKVLIATSPITITLDTPAEANVGSDTTISLNIRSGNTDPISGVLVNVLYPAGFRFKSATPLPYFGNNVWNLGSLVNGADRTIKITGTLDGQDDEKKFFKVTTGVASESGSDSQIAVPYNASSATILMRRSFVDLGLALNGSDSADIITSAGNTIRGDVNWVNNLPDKLLNGEVIIKLSGNAVDQSSISLVSGSYRSTDNTIMWTQQHESALGIIESGGSSHVNFDLATLSVGSLNALGVKNPYVDIELTFKATRVVDGAPGAVITNTVKRRVRVDTRLDLAARAVYTSGPFINSGPMPPRANLETTYTMIWSISNTSNDLSGVRVSAILPSYIRFMNVVSPSNADLRYDNTKGELVWNVGDVGARSSDAPASEVSFQIALLPSIPQIGQTLPLITNIKTSGKDTFTGSNLSDSVGVVDMRVVTDPNYREEYSKVIP